MATKISFFEVTEKEKIAFERYFHGPKYSLSFHHEKIEEVEAYLYNDSDIISVFNSSRIDSHVLNHMPKLKFIAVRATGVDNIDLKNCKKRGIAVSNVPGYGKTTVAEYAIMLMLMVFHKMPMVEEAVRSGRVDYRKLTGHTLNGKNLGIIGAGRIGTSVARIAKAMGMHVTAYDPFPNEIAAEQIGYSYTKLDDLLRGADIVSIHATLNPSSAHMINKETLKMMNPDAILINTARGGIVSTPDLISALKIGEIAGAALDCIEGEQTIDVEVETDLLLGKNSAEYSIAEVDVLSKMKNVILSPHNAFNSAEALYILRKTTAQNIHCFISKNPRNLIKLN